MNGSKEQLEELQQEFVGKMMEYDNGDTTVLDALLYLEGFKRSLEDCLAVIKEFRYAGIGAALVKHSLQSLKRIGCIKVNLQIRSTNKDVEKFYKSLGFETEERVSMGVFI